jgi:hypothetical protein
VLLHKASPSSLGQLLGITDLRKSRYCDPLHENNILFNERESLNKAIVLMSEMMMETLQHSMTSTNFILHCHFELSICGCVLQMWRGGGHSPLNLTSKIFVCLIVRCILWSGDYALLIKAPTFSWPVSQVYFWISEFRCIMLSYSISVYTAVAIFVAKYISLCQYMIIYLHRLIYSVIFSDNVTATSYYTSQYTAWVQSQINVYTLQSEIMISVQVSPPKHLDSFAKCL